MLYILTFFAGFVVAMLLNARLAVQVVEKDAPGEQQAQQTAAQKAGQKYRLDALYGRSDERKIPVPSLAPSALPPGFISDYFINYVQVIGSAREDSIDNLARASMSFAHNSIADKKSMMLESGDYAIECYAYFRISKANVTTSTSNSTSHAE